MPEAIERSLAMPVTSVKVAVFAPFDCANVNYDRLPTALKEAELPFVLIGRSEEERELAYVDIDLHAAVRQSLAHLIALGHRSA